jgi:hypothetical protein
MGSKYGDDVTADHGVCGGVAFGAGRCAGGVWVSGLSERRRAVDSRKERSGERPLAGQDACVEVMAAQ